MWAPLPPQAEPFAEVWIQEIESVIILAEAQFILGFAEHRLLRDPRFFVCRIELQGLLEFQPRLLPFSGGSQCPATRHVHLGSLRIEFHGNIERAQGLLGLALAQIHVRQPQPIVRIALGDLQNLQVLPFRLRQFARPFQNAGPPGPHVHILRCARDLLIDDAHCRRPIFQFGIVADLCLPVGRRVLPPDRQSQ